MNKIEDPIDLVQVNFDLKNHLARQARRVNDRLENIFSESTTDHRIFPAMKHSLMAGGKRLRPVLCIAAADAVGASDDFVVTAGCALEMIHTYSLIHDDLPALDNDDLRRGLPSCHAAFDEATAILAGDALLTAAFETLAKAGLSDVKRMDKWLKIINIAGEASGYGGMIEGQMQDISSEKIRLNAEELETMHLLKTGALIKAAVAIGCILADGDENQFRKLQTYSQNIGLAFQVADDILNLEGDPALMGKAVGTDQALNKNTYPSILGLEQSKEFAKELIGNALQAISDFDKKSDPLRAIAGYVINRRR